MVATDRGTTQSLRDESKSLSIGCWFFLDSLSPICVLMFCIRIGNEYWSLVIYCDNEMLGRDPIMNFLSGAGENSISGKHFFQSIIMVLLVGLVGDTYHKNVSSTHEYIVLMIELNYFILFSV